VQRKLAEYLAALARLGVAGVRLDAAKHIQPVELDAILSRTHAILAAEGRPMPYWFAEVIDYGGEAVTARDYFGLAYAAGGAADITEFRFRAASDHWLSRNGRRPSGLADVSPAAWQLMPSEKAVVFVENHDTQRDGGVWFRDGALHRLANVWLLAQPYGYPKVLSGYAFERGFQAGRDAGPPAVSPRATDGCAPVAAQARLGQWTCDHRDPWVAPMVAFRAAVAGRPLELPWSDGADALAFSRGDAGFVAINAGSVTLDATIPVRLAPGAYCDLLTGGGATTGCAGRVVTVAADRTVTLSLDARTAIAVRAGITP
jgi:alpha-amylase